MVDNKKAGRPYLLFFGAICIVFIGILVMANPVMLDEQGKVAVTR